MPPVWRDVSQVRQVPDHQEVWQGEKVEGGVGGSCLVVEMLALEDDVPDADASGYFFNDLADANGAVGASRSRVDASFAAGVGCAPRGPDSDEDSEAISDDIKAEQQRRSSLSSAASPPLKMPLLTHRAMACSCVGLQRVAKGRDVDDAGKSRKGNQEVELVRVELCAVRLRPVMTDLLVTLSVPVETVGRKESMDLVKKAVGHSELFREVVQSLKIDDWTLFA